MSKRPSKQQQTAMENALRTLKGMDFKAMRARIRDKLNARNEYGPRWT